MKSTVERIINFIDRLPPFPFVAMKIISMARDENISMKEIAEVVQHDPSITANVLKWCNSPFFGLRRKVTSIHEALVYLGIKYLIEIVMLSSCASYLDKKLVGYELEQGELWHHSVACAILSQILAEKVGYQEKTLLFTGGLLHDIGKIVLGEFVKEALLKIKMLIARGKDFLEAEREVLGMDHAELGAKIGEKWNFPEEILRLIAYHHRPKETKDPAVALVHIADAGVLMLGIGAGMDGLAYKAKDEAYKLLGLKEKDLMSCMGDLWAELVEIEETIFRE